MKKKLFILLICLFMLAGCKKEEEVIVQHKFDYINYLDLDLIGPDGYAVLDINIADFSVNDFESDADYIKIKKFMNLLIDSVVASKTDSIVNGDVIEIGISSAFDITQVGDLDINLDVHTLEVTGLTPPRELDLYDSANVMFYGLEGTQKISYYFPNSSQFSKEAKENLSYSILIDDESVEKNKTVMAIDAILNQELLDSNRRYGNVQRYFGSNGYVVEPSAERTLKMVVNESALESVDKAKLRNAISDKIKEDEELEGYTFKQVMSIQNSESPFIYYAVALYKGQEREVYVKYSMQIVYVNNEIKITDFIRESSVDAMYANEAFGDAKMMYTFNVFELTNEETEQNKTEVNKETEQTETNS